MININLLNAEEILFLNKEIRDNLPEFRQIFQQWDFAKSTLVLRSIAKKSIMDLLNNISPAQIDIIEFVEFPHDKIKIIGKIRLQVRVTKTGVVRIAIVYTWI